ncbi:MAG TPA: hypothetical protein VNZ22_08160 [Bacillota bacterium]|nr:hypothetical protein [Bacillota bacterium]
MESPVIRPDNLHRHTDHERRKISPIYKWLGLARHGRVRRKKIRSLRVGLCVGLIASLLFGLLIWSMNDTPQTQSQKNIPGKKARPLKR